MAQRNGMPGASLPGMRSYPEYTVVVPAYNEEGRLEPMIREAAEYFRARGASAEIIVVDDGSRDGTSALVQRLMTTYGELRLIRLARNRGKGHAVRSGVVNAEGHYVLFADADGSTPMAELERLDAAIQAGAAIAIGSREVAGEGVRVRARWHRRIIGRSFHALVATLTVRGILDTQCGFKLLRADVAQELFSRMLMEGFSFDVELLMMAQRRGHRIVEVPVNWTHRPGSRVNLVADSLRMMRDLFVIRAHAVRGDYNVPHLAPLQLPIGAASDTAEDVAHAPALL
jgi:dolichyl-phosphate beta-glucosyltransferase